MTVSPDSKFPVGGEWRLTTTWASRADYYESLYSVWQAGIRACMGSRGFKYNVPRYVNSDLFYRELNPLNEAVALRFGYHEPPAPGAQDVNPNPSAAFSTASVECGNLAQRVAYEDGPTARALSLLEALHQGAEAAIGGFDESETGRLVLDRWRSCVSARGFPYRDPADAAGRFRSEQVVTKSELGARLVDLECDKRVGLTRSRSEFEAASRATWSDKNAESIAQLVIMIEDDRKRAISKLELLEANGADALVGMGVAPTDSAPRTASSLANP